MKTLLVFYALGLVSFFLIDYLGFLKELQLFAELFCKHLFRMFSTKQFPMR